jgi:uncharacterized protein YeaC (DUF1315 family)
MGFILLIWFKRGLLWPMNKLIPDQRHPNKALMYNLGLNICNYLEENLLDVAERRSQHESLESCYQTFDASEFKADAFIMKNRKFSEYVIPVGEGGFKFPDKCHAMSLVEIGKWSNGTCLLKINNSTEPSIVKPFNAINSFSEIKNSTSIDSDVVMSSVLEKTQLTERSVNTGIKALSPESLVLIKGMLLRKPSVAINRFWKVGLSNDLGILMLSAFPYIKAIVFYLQKNIN